MPVLLRPMVRADLPLLGRWLRDPLVREWWHDDPSPAAVERQYGPALDGADPTVLRLGVEGDRPVGFVQWYRLADEPGYLAELSAQLAVPEEARSLDHLIGEPRDRGRGLGTAQLLAALAEIGAAPLVVPVHARNTASIAALQRAGLSIGATVDLRPDNPAHTREHVVLVRP